MAVRERLVSLVAAALGVSDAPGARCRAPDPPPSPGSLDGPPHQDVSAGDERVQFWKHRYAQQLQEIAEQRRASDPARSDGAMAERAHDFATRLEILKAYLEVAKAAPERAKAAAQFIQTAASAVGTIYTALLALAFSGAAGAVRLDPRALAPGLFLGLAIALATAFLAFITQGRTSEAATGSGDFETAQAHRLNAFIAWSRELVDRRAYLLRAGVISLASGVFLLPVPLIDPQLLSLQRVIWLSGIGLALTLLGPCLYVLCARGVKLAKDQILPTAVGR